MYDGLYHFAYTLEILIKVVMSNLLSQIKKGRITVSVNPISPILLQRVRSSETLPLCLWLLVVSRFTMYKYMYIRFTIV